MEHKDTIKNYIPSNPIQAEVLPNESKIQEILNRVGVQNRNKFFGLTKGAIKKVVERRLREIKQADLEAYWNIYTFVQKPTHDLVNQQTLEPVYSKIWDESFDAQKWDVAPATATQINNLDEIISYFAIKECLI